METVTLPAAATSAGDARAMVGAALEHCDPRVRETVVLMTSELVSNVIRHANTEVRVSVEPGPPIRVEVHDHVAATDAFRAIVTTRPEPVPRHAPGGRGLPLVHDLASRIGLVDDVGGGKVVWFEVDVP
jgi:anti-sigma regulatory factor (Ser/Thr protein kinase)